MFLAHLIWNPDRNFFVVPYIEHPVTWYGLLFAFGFLVGYFLIRRIFARFLADPTPPERELEAVKLTDRLALLVIVGTIVGARLGHVFFYGWPYFSRHPLEIFKVWEGGLASHGGAIGILLGLLIFVWWNRREKPRLTFLAVLDIVVIPAAFAAGCIRIGNFMNQEITGMPTTLPWGVIFPHTPAGMQGIAVHPVQLYESASYFAVFLFLYLMWKLKADRIGRGLFAGWFFTLVFSTRFLLEYLKTPLSEWFDESVAPLSMGQILSLPFILVGVLLLIWYYRRAKHDATS